MIIKPNGNSAVKALRILSLPVLILGSQLQAHAQGTAFSYQGNVFSNGSPANGSFDLTFAVYPVNSGGTVLAGPVTNSGVGLTNGLFTTLVDFGPGVFTGTSNWLQIGVRSSGAGSFNVLTPRQLVASTPYAIQAANAENVTGLTVQQNTSGGPNLIGGTTLNFVSANVVGATVGGGGASNYLGTAYSNGVSASFGTVAGGADNVTAGTYSVIGGGIGNTINNMSSQSTIAGGAYNATGGLGYDTVGGGYGNTANGVHASTVAGGEFNTANGGYASTVGGGQYNLAGAGSATVGGGSSNLATGFYSTVPGGSLNTASAYYSFAAGQQAQAANQGAFVWADSQNSPFTSVSNDTFNVRAQGGVNFVTSGAGLTIDGQLVGPSSAGPGSWQVPASTSVQATANTSYLLTNSQLVTLTLPTTPVAGNYVEVFCSGAGGWQLIQNPGQNTLYNTITLSSSTNWTKTSAPITAWSGIASSSDGTILAASIGAPGGVTGGIYLSTNSGATWNITSAPQKSWSGIACSGNGTFMLSGTANNLSSSNQVFYSTNMGSTWTQATGLPATSFYSAYVCSADGTVMAATSSGGKVYLSTNSGTSWASIASVPGTGSVYGLAGSSDCSVLAAANSGGFIYVSTFPFTSWVAQNVPSSTWLTVACSADGGKLIAAADPGVIYTASYSTNWTRTSINTGFVAGAVSSADGTRLAVSVLVDGVHQYILQSLNSGMTWFTNGPATNWSALTCSADGTKLAGAVGPTFTGGGNYGGIYTSGYTYTNAISALGDQGVIGGGPGSGMKLVYAGNGQFVVVSQQGDVYGP